MNEIMQLSHERYQAIWLCLIVCQLDKQNMDIH